MEKKIRAEFENIDQAEHALRTLRHEVAGLRQLRILARRQQSGQTGSAYAAVAEQPYSLMAAAALAAENLRRHEASGADDDLPEPYQRQTAVLEVLCGEDALGRVSAAMTSLGGSGISVGF